MNQRNHAFDFLCGLCIIRMVLLHVVSICGYRNEFWFTKVMAWTFFFMSFFFFKAGYFNKGVSGDTLPYLKDRARRLIVPYVIWGAIGSAIFFSFLLLFPRQLAPYYKALYWEHLWQDSHFWGNPPLWFLFSFCTTYILVHLIGKCPTLRIGTFRLSPSLLIIGFPFVSYWLWRQHNPMWMSLNNVFMGVFFFTLGRIWRWFSTRVSRPKTIAISLILITCFIVGNKLWHGQYDMSLNKFASNPWGAGINTICALIGISGLLLSIHMRRIPVLCHIGQHSMVYFVAHYPLIFIYTLTHSVFRHSVHHHWDEVIIMLLFVFITCTWLAPYIERVSWLSGIYHNGKKTTE